MKKQIALVVIVVALFAVALPFAEDLEFEEEIGPPQATVSFDIYHKCLQKANKVRQEEFIRCLRKIL